MTSGFFSRHRRWGVAIALGTVVLVFCGGWAVALAVQSPAQREAASRPPASVPVTAVVVRGDLGDEISGTATLERTSRDRVEFAVDEARSVVTKTPTGAGETLAAGSVLLEVNGRPVFALPGAFPFYRDLTPGLTGPDVAQLQNALTAAGFTVAADGSFGAQTVNAVTRLYRQRSYALATVPADEPGDDNGSGSDSGSESDEDQHAAQTAGDPALHTQESTIRIPLTELAVTKAPSSTVVSVPPVGTSLAADSRAVLERGTVQAITALPSSVAGPIRTGMQGAISGPNGTEHRVRVVSVTAGSGDEDSTVRLEGRDKEIPMSLSKGRIVVRLEVDLVARDSLIVPTRSVATGGTGRAHVQVKRRGGSFERIEVDELGELGGRSAVRPRDARALTAGDLVRIT